MNACAHVWEIGRKRNDRGVVELLTEVAWCRLCGEVRERRPGRPWTVTVASRAEREAARQRNVEAVMRAAERMGYSIDKSARPEPGPSISPWLRHDVPPMDPEVVANKLHHQQIRNERLAEEARVVLERRAELAARREEERRRRLRR